AFIETAINKIKKLKQMIQHCSNEVLIEVDGGVKLDNAQRILDAGADILVSGSGVFSQADPIAAIQTLKNLQRNN
nr:ribulose-phosphate 3-epimerase [Chitinophagales bacterium]